VNAKKKLEIRIILPAKAGEIFVGLGIQPANRFQVADWGSEIRFAGRCRTRLPEKPKGAVYRDEIINERNGGYAEEKIIERRRNYCTPRVSMRSSSKVVESTCSTHC
jgi:hypothetical protein